MNTNDHNGQPAPGDRGLYEFGRITDTYGSKITVSSSSAACEPCIWISTDRDGREWQAEPSLPGGVYVFAPHLNVDQATRLRDALNRFIDRAEAT